MSIKQRILQKKLEKMLNSKSVPFSSAVAESVTKQFGDLSDEEKEYIENEINNLDFNKIFN